MIFFSGRGGGVVSGLKRVVGPVSDETMQIIKFSRATLRLALKLAVPSYTAFVGA